MKKAALTLVILTLTISSAFSQVTWFKKSSYGIQADYVYPTVQPYEYAEDGTESIPNHHFNDTEHGFLVKVLYEENFTNHFGIHAGLGYEYRYNTDQKYDYYFLTDERVLKSHHLHIPVSLLVRTGRFFWIEPGIEFDIPLIVNYTHNDFYPTMNKQVGINVSFGMRFRLYRQLSLGLGIRWGVKSYLHYQGYAGHPDRPVYYNDLNYYHRGINVSLRYQFSHITE